MNLNQTRAASGACPTFFRALCRTASAPGSPGYADVGYQFAGAIAGIVADDRGDEADALLDDLARSIFNATPGRADVGTPDDVAVLAWLDRELPRCMALIPRDRRGAFLRGIYRWTRDEGNDITSR